MPKGKNQKFKLYRLAQIMSEKTDETHFLTINQIKDELSHYDITADRKSLYADLQDLEILGLEVKGESCGNSYHYHVVNRQFELAELKLLVDAIQASKFITEKKSNKLIRKLEKMVSQYEANELQRQVIVSGRIKTMNETIYYSIDTIHMAIAQNKKIRFQYFQWNLQKKPELRHEGRYYWISPWSLVWDDENYYLVGYDSDAEKIKHYRVDKMLKISLTEADRDGRDAFEALDMAVYTRQNFGMYGGEEWSIKLRVKNALVGVIIDRFGKDIIIIPDDSNHFIVNVDVQVSDLFYGWITAFRGNIQIIGPNPVIQGYMELYSKIKNSVKF